MTYSHAEVISLIEKAIKDGRAAQREGRPVDANPYTGRYRSWWAEGWYREQEEK